MRASEPVPEPLTADFIGLRHPRQIARGVPLCGCVLQPSSSSHAAWHPPPQTASQSSFLPCFRTRVKIMYQCDLREYMTFYEYEVKNNVI